jgi:very-short-patch-repair endonuclease
MAVAAVLAGAGIDARPQVSAAGLRVDLAVASGERRLAIEVDGAAWHQAVDGGLHHHDLVRLRRLHTAGWDVLHLWAVQVRDDPAGCVQRVRTWLDGPGGEAGR